MFVHITADDAEDLPVPGEAYSFAVLKQAQALGDLHSLRGKNRRVARFHLKKSVTAGMAEMSGLVEAAIKQTQDVER